MQIPKENDLPSRPTIVCLCGSTRFWREFQKANFRETLAGKIVLSIGCATGTDSEHFSHLPNEEWGLLKEKLDQLHLRKIELANEVLILNVGQPWCPSCEMHCLTWEGRSSCCHQQILMRGYIGESTQRELDHAIKLGKVVRFLESR